MLKLPFKLSKNNIKIIVICQSDPCIYVHVIILHFTYIYVRPGLEIFKASSSRIDPTLTIYSI